MRTFKNRKTRGGSLRLISKDLSDQASINKNNTHIFDCKLAQTLEVIQDFQSELAENALHTDNPDYRIVECADRLDEAEHALAAFKGAL